jgi:hypothetical protein
MRSKCAGQDTVSVEVGGGSKPGKGGKMITSSAGHDVAQKSEDMKKAAVKMVRFVLLIVANLSVSFRTALRIIMTILA